MERDEHPDETDRPQDSKEFSKTLDALERAAVALEAALRESTRLSRHGKKSGGKAA